jgi:hypothetical protein
MIKLLVKCDGESREAEYAQAEISIGRSGDNVIPLNDKKSSRKHAKIEKVNEEYLINDLGSGNGTKVNGKDVNTHVLSKGDEITIGLTTIYVLALDTPAGRQAPAAAAPAAVPAAVAAPAAAPAAPAPSPSARNTERRSAESMDEARRKITRRAIARNSSTWVGTAASIVVLIGIAAAGFWGYGKYEEQKYKDEEARALKAQKESEPYRMAEAAYKGFAKTAEADPVEDSVIAQATSLAEQHGALYPEFDTLLGKLKQRRSEQIGRDDFASVDNRISSALRDYRFGDALQALKDLKAGTDGAAAGGLVAKVCDKINQEFKSIDDYGRRLADEKKWTIAADHYRLQAAKFKGTEHYRYLMYKPETLEQVRKAEADVVTAKANRSAETPKPSEPDNSLAKAEPEKPKETPKPVEPEPAKPAAMPKEPEKPKPAMPKEPEKPKTPPPPPPPPPAKPKEPEKPKEEPKPAEPGAPFKKPDVLCDCKKIVKGVYCLKCDRMLAQEDMRNGVCKRCEEKPKKIDLCVKKYYMVDGQPDKRSEKPILYEGKLYDFAYEDKARITYYCEGCQETGDSSAEVKHKPDCASKNVIKVCSKSGAPPHGGEKK